jgi:hypothetical protein
MMLICCILFVNEKGKGMKYILKKIKKFSLSMFERAVSYPVTTVLIVTGVVMT